jgi:TolB-like protein/Tfp pilus assembly protein PilF
VSDARAGERKLAAIMFTDIVGYTALTQSDEARALDVLERHNKLLRPIFPKHNGREIKTIGDAFLVEFDSALAATQCAVEIQEFLHDYNVSSQDEWKIKLRIGIHLGDVVHKSNDVLGDAVNIASRIQPLADPEGICISEQVYDQVHNKTALSLERLAQSDLKNVRFVTEVYKIILPWEKDRKDTPERIRLDKRRIAVLPFDNISPNPNDAYFSDGMTEELISTISKISGLQVIARTSVIRYKNATKGIEEIGRELEVGSVLEGSVRMAGDRLRVTTQLIDARTSNHVWSDSYDRRLDDVFAIQSDIAKRVADVLQVKLVKDEEKRVESKATDSLDAYTLYLKAAQKMYERTPTAIKEAIHLFELAVAKDTRFALAYSGLGACYLVLLDYGQMPAAEVLPRAREYSKKALDIDRNLVEAHTVLALTLEHDYDPVNAEKEYKLAISLNPNYASAHHWYAVCLSSLGRPPEAIEEMKIALRADPLSPIIRTVLGSMYLDAGMNEEAWNQWEDTLKFEPGFFVLYLWRSIWLIKFGKLDEAKKELRRGLVFSPGHSRLMGVLGYACAAKGETDEAKTILNELLKSRSENFVGGESIACVYAGLNDPDKFFEYLEIAVREKTVGQYLLRYLCIFDSFRQDPRYAKILRDANIM